MLDQTARYAENWRCFGSVGVDPSNNKLILICLLKLFLYIPKLLHGSACYLLDKSSFLKLHLTDRSSYQQESHGKRQWLWVDQGIPNGLHGGQLTPQAPKSLAWGHPDNIQTLERQDMVGFQPRHRISQQLIRKVYGFLVQIIISFEIGKKNLAKVVLESECV